MDLCRSCGGLWCEPSEWDREELGPPPTFGAGEPQTGFRRSSSSTLSCPEGDGQLVRLRSEHVEGLEIDACDQCGGIWFDRREWDYLAALRDWQAHQERLGQFSSWIDTKWNQWLFQLLCGLPVELNVPPRRPPTVILALIGVCLGLQLLGAFQPLLFLAVGKEWMMSPRGAATLVSHIFVHDGWIHLLGNMYFLYILGDNVEDVLGRARFLGFFLLCGVVAALLELSLAGPNPKVLVGASGAIFGVIAAYLVLFHRAKLTFMPPIIPLQLRLPASVWIVGWFAFNLLMLLSQQHLGSVGPSVAWAAHVAGFLAGLALILPFRRSLVEGHPLLHLLETRRI